MLPGSATTRSRPSSRRCATGYVGARKLNSIVPFGEFKNLTDDDLKAMYAYVHTLQPVKHRVDNTLVATYCKLCKQKHGAGEEN